MNIKVCCTITGCILVLIFVAMFLMRRTIWDHIYLPEEKPFTKPHDYHTQPIRRDNITVITDISYNVHERNKLDLYLPKENNFKTIVFIHGGCWEEGDKDMYGSIGYFFAKNGFGVVAVNYRLSPNVKYPAHIEDVACAFNWTYKNIHKYGGSSKSLYLFGHSSGAHLATLLATNQRFLNKYQLSNKDIKGVIGVSGLYYIGLYLKVAGLDYIFPTKQDRLDASPIHHLGETEPPFLLVYAEKEIRTLNKQAVLMYNAMQKKGLECQLYCGKGKNHVTVLLDMITPNSKISNITIEFLK